MKVTLDRESAVPVYWQIFEQIRGQILAGEMVPGYRLPPERKLAERLGVNRTTVLNAYRELKAEGLVGSQVGKGTVVLAYPEEELDLSHYPEEPAWNQIFSQYSQRFESYMVKDLLTLASRKDVISFATGIASPETGPMQALAGIEEEIVAKKNYRALLHTPTEGFTSLREAVCGLMHQRGVYCQREEVMLLSGSQQGIELAARIFLDPGDIVVVEEPSFFPAIQAFRSIGARVIGIPIDEQGMRVDELEQLLLRYRPKLIYTMPTFHNPSGTEMELERRKQLMEVANKYGVLLLEDDAYGDLCYEGHQYPLLKSMDRNGYVIYLSTFSKNLYSGLRLGWLVANKKVVQKFSAAKQLIDLHSNSLSQWIVERFIVNGSLETHIPKVCEEYRARRDAMCQALSQYAPANVRWNKPRGGYYIWCKLPDGVSAAKLLLKAAEYKVVFVPGTPFFTAGQGDDYIRLNFTFAPFADIPEGIKRLCLAMKDLMAARDDQESSLDIEINPIV
ncbi:MocR-like pyridoxine biosynthesis transcription factor PdxR [Desulfotomaculum sp. 1211_IL3151]|uniref:MocR-like pyridoxine biosynthesis transcription factor PdxR n=1 Tax=Desulfotomaculum sp. 1211_IL3151 TaxID=3084055 RepID=UPI002FDA97D9